MPSCCGHGDATFTVIIDAGVVSSSNEHIVDPNQIDKDLFALAVLRAMRLLPGMSSAKHPLPAQ
jgi:hypothetical protein